MVIGVLVMVVVIVVMVVMVVAGLPTSQVSEEPVMEGNGNCSGPLEGLRRKARRKEGREDEK